MRRIRREDRFSLSKYVSNVIDIVVQSHNNIDICYFIVILFVFCARSLIVIYIYKKCIFMCVVVDDILDCTSTTAELGKTVGKDMKVNKATYVKFLGLQKSKSEALRLAEEAKRAISNFGNRALPLIQIADFIITRRN